MPSYPVCLSDSEISVIIDLLYERRGKFSSQTELNADTTPSDALLFKLLSIGTGDCTDMANCNDVLSCLTGFNFTRIILPAISRAGFNPYPFVPESERIPLTEQQKSAPIAPTPQLPNSECDYDSLYAGIRSFVNIIADTILQFWQMMDIEGRDISKLSRVLSAIPILGSLPLDELAVARDFLVDEVVDAYHAYDSPLARDQVACKIFEIVKCAGRCDVNYNDIAQALGELALDVVVPASVEELWGLITNLVAGFTAPELVYYGSLSMAIGAIGLGTEALGINFLDLSLMMQLGFDEPSGDWTILCQSCGNEPQLEIYASNGENSLEFDGIDTYTLYLKAGTFASIRVIGGNENNCDTPFRPENITVLIGSPTGREWRNCPGGTIDSANAPLTDAEGLLMSYYAVSSTTSIGGTDFTITFTLGAV